MLIKVLLSEIEQSKINKIIDTYNDIKPENEPRIEHLARAEGGFQIQIKNMQSINCDPNEKIKQLRWKHGLLLPHLHYQSLTYQEQYRLYISLIQVLGKEHVMKL